MKATPKKSYVLDAKGFTTPLRVQPPKNGGQYLRDSAIMLLKTNAEKMSLLGSAIIFMKTKDLFHSCHYVYKNKWT
jgi:hypothetical protein